MTLDDIEKDIKVNLDFIDDPELGEYHIDIGFTNREWIEIYNKLLQVIALARAAKKLIDTPANLTVTGFDPTYWVDSHELLRREVKEVFGNDA